MAFWVKTKKEFELSEKINSEYLPRVRVLYPFNIVRQYYMDNADGFHHCINFKSGCKIELISVDKINSDFDSFEDVEEHLDYIYFRSAK